MLEVGRFTFNEATGTLTGPADYMREQGDAKLDAILAGKDEAFNMSAHYSPNIPTAVLVHLQTDYAGWRGTRELTARLGR